MWKTCLKNFLGWDLGLLMYKLVSKYPAFSTITKTKEKQKSTQFFVSHSDDGLLLRAHVSGLPKIMFFELTESLAQDRPNHVAPELFHLRARSLQIELHAAAFSFLPPRSLRLPPFLYQNGKTPRPQRPGAFKIPHNSSITYMRLLNQR